MPTPTFGTIVGGKYKILRALGEGGMGTVYEAEHVLTQKRAAVKWVHPQVGAPEQAYQRLLHEARATSRIRHRNVVDVYDVLREDDAICLVMQLLMGEPLSAAMAQASMPMHEFVGLLLSAMRGVAAAHAVGVVHRDIKPENIFLAREPGQVGPVPKVIDFGISKLLDAELPSLTRSGITMGTPKYVSYEQLIGARDVDGRADIYAFGVILYEALTGRAPYYAATFGAQAVSFATSIPSAPRELRPEIPEAFDTIVRRAIAKRREERFASLSEFIAELEPFARSEAYPVELKALAQAAQELPSGVAAPGQTTTPQGQTPDPELLRAEAQREAAANAQRVRQESAPTSPLQRANTPLLLAGGIALAGLLAILSHGPPSARRPEPAPAGPLGESGPVTSKASAQGSGPAASAAPEPATDPEASGLAAAPLAAPPVEPVASAVQSDKPITKAHGPKLHGGSATTTPGSAELRPTARKGAAQAADAGALAAEPLGRPAEPPAEPLAAPAESTAAPAEPSKDAPAHRAGPLERDEF